MRGGGIRKSRKKKKKKENLNSAFWLLLVNCVFFLFPSLCYATKKIIYLITENSPSPLIIDKRIRCSPFYIHPTMTCKISCLWSEKSENAVQRGHRCPHIYLSGQFLKVHLQKYTVFLSLLPDKQYKQF